MTVWRNNPFKIEVKAGETKAFCMCGLSMTPPFCDGSHKTTDITPKIETFHKDKKIYACGCAQSARRPYCDGSHNNVEK
jgi:CDGSH-type Zn-finger protein